MGGGGGGRNKGNPSENVRDWFFFYYGTLEHVLYVLIKKCPEILQLSQILWDINHNFVVHIP